MSYSSSSQTRRRVTIQALLRWAFHDELPKREFGESGQATYLAVLEALGTRVSGSSPLQFYAALGGPVHPDALVLEAAVLKLKDTVLHLADPRVLLADFDAEGLVALGAEMAHAAALRSNVAGLVARQAQVGRAPDWQVSEEEIPKPALVRHPRSGAPAWFVMQKVRCRSGTSRWYEEREVDGYDPVAKRARPGAYRRYVYEPSPEGIVERRCDWLAHALALGIVAESVAHALTCFEVEPEGKVTLPWAPGTAFNASLGRRSSGGERAGITRRARDAGRRAAARFNRDEARGLTAAGT